MGSFGEALSNQRIGWCCIDRLSWHLLAGIPQPEARVGDRFIRYTSNGKMIVLYDGEDLRVVESHPDATSHNAKEEASVELKEISRIPLDLGSPQSNNFVQSMEVAGDGTRAALEICNPRQGSVQTVRVYDLASRSILRQWKFEKGCVFSGYNPISWDPKGSRLAVSLPEYGGGSPHRLPFIKNKSHLYILDVTSGKILNDIRTGYIAGPVCFTGNDTVLTASLNADSGYFREDTISEWNIGSGQRVRELESVPQGVHSLLRLSADGNLILAYIGREKPVEHFLENDYVEFGLWDYRTGKLITTSGHVERPQPANVLEHRVGPMASFGSGSDRIVVADSGSRVLIWWHQSSRPLLVYDITSA
jgi:hypothetical protein